MLHLVQLRKGLSRELLNDFFFIKILHGLREEFPTELKLFFIKILRGYICSQFIKS